MKICFIQSCVLTDAGIAIASCERLPKRRSILLTRYSAVDFGLAERIVVTVVNFLVALMLLGVIAGPFLVRRTRRGLHSQLH